MFDRNIQIKILTYLKVIVAAASTLWSMVSTITLRGNQPSQEQFETIRIPKGKPPIDQTKTSIVQNFKIMQNTQRKKKQICRGLVHTTSAYQISRGASIQTRTSSILNRYSFTAFRSTISHSWRLWRLQNLSPLYQQEFQNQFLTWNNL